jgi:hypothetical protein
MLIMSSHLSNEVGALSSHELGVASYVDVLSKQNICVGAEANMNYIYAGLLHA